MEYMIGAAIAMIAYTISNRIAYKNLKPDNNIEIVYSQSHVYELMRPFMEFAPLLEEPDPKQSSNYLKSSYLKVMVVNKKAYWIKDNIFYVADVVDGKVQKETQKEVDTMSMDKVELKEMLFIVEKLREDSDDNWGSGQSKF